MKGENMREGVEIIIFYFSLIFRVLAISKGSKIKNSLIIYLVILEIFNYYNHHHINRSELLLLIIRERK